MNRMWPCSTISMSSAQFLWKRFAKGVKTECSFANRSHLSKERICPKSNLLGVFFFGIEELLNLPEKYTCISSTLIAECRDFKKPSSEKDILQLLAFSRRVINEGKIIVHIFYQEMKAFTFTLHLLLTQ